MEGRGSPVTRQSYAASDHVRPRTWREEEVQLYANHAASDHVRPRTWTEEEVQLYANHMLPAIILG
jgi:hypothetical protein